MILTSADRAKDFPTRPVYIRGTGESVETPMVSQMETFNSSRAFKTAGPLASFSDSRGLDGLRPCTCPATPKCTCTTASECRPSPLCTWVSGPTTSPRRSAITATEAWMIRCMRRRLYQNSRSCTEIGSNFLLRLPKTSSGPITGVPGPMLHVTLALRILLISMRFEFWRGTGCYVRFWPPAPPILPRCT